MVERVIQFGEGGFLRGFADWMLQIANEKNVFSGKVVVVQPIEKGLCDMLEAQGCMYTHLCRGAEGVDVKKIDVISRCVKPYDDFDTYMALAQNPDFRFVISNTTEAGIAFVDTDKITDRPANSFPGKLTQLLKARFDMGLSGFVFLPCELIDRNGDNLKKCVLQYADLWNLGGNFKTWIEKDNIFCNTLVDRINTGYPKEEQIDVGFDDKMINTSEYFHLWVIEGYNELFNEIPFDKCGLNVILTVILKCTAQERYAYLTAPIPHLCHMRFSRDLIRSKAVLMTKKCLHTSKNAYMKRLFQHSIFLAKNLQSMRIT